MLVKICGINDLKSALVAVENGANALGFVFAPSFRQIIPEKAKKIIDDIPKGVLRVGVFVDAPISLVNEIAEYCSLSVLQLHGSESVDYCRQLEKPVLKAIRIGEKGNFYLTPEPYKGIVWAFLADTYQPRKSGGTGLSFPWKKVDNIRRYGQVILAGGLNPYNVYQALNIARPDGVDISSGVETNGQKDPEKIIKFIKEVRRWENEQNITR
ncbi:MAG TPA: N-(5'-phosphoribosyl)anthranilate isomerase [Candidatus Atribacteria bacterium]|nr:N-(5'-phosphoribosyl)anthranilate isomerase [Candidatus Atribacteria bacterium]